MRKILLAVLSVVVFLCHSMSATGQEKKNENVIFSPGARIGYNRGIGIHPYLTASGFESGFPFDLRLGVGYTFINPGDALDARRIFINNNTNGTPEKRGRSIDISFDFLLPRPVLGISNSYLVFGPRFSSFKGNFKYIGGNEDFDVKSHQWGVGFGAEHCFEMEAKLEMVFSYGIDLYAPSTLTGHDTSYSPDNDNVNPRTDNENDNAYFIYKDANRAIRQPFIMPYIMLGINF